MQAMRLFLDTHARERDTFPPELTVEQFQGFLGAYEAACAAEQVVLLKVHVGLEAGRAFCLTMAADIDAVQRAHQRVGLPYDSITEVRTATPGDLFFAHH